MLKPKRGHSQPGTYWRSVSDEHLLNVDLMIEDPTALENLVFDVPQGDEEAFVEFFYDQRKTGRDPFHCVHGNHAHLFGYVMNKGGKRFMVGWICGRELYGEDFRLYTKDHEYAIERQQALRRVHEVRNIIDPFIKWVADVRASDVFRLYETTKDRMTELMPWLVQQLQWHTNYAGGELGDIKLPKTLFDGFSDPKAEFAKAAADISKDGMLLIGKTEIQKDVTVTLARMQHSLTELERAIGKLNELVDFSNHRC